MARAATDATDVATVWTNARRGAFGQLSAALLARRQVVALVGDVGLGKATMLREWRRQCGHSTRVFWMAGATGDATADSASLASAFALESANGVAVQVRDMLQHDEDGRFSNVLVIEDAHNLPAGLLGDLARMTRVDNDGLPLLQLVLSGDATLYDMLEDQSAFPDVELIDLPSLTQTSTATLFKRRVGDVSVDASVLESVFELTGGVPGQIVALAEAALADLATDGGDSLTEARFVDIVDRIDAAPPVPAPRALPPEVNDPSKLPSSIAKSDDPRNMLRWAFGLSEDEDDISTQGGALHVPPSRPANAPVVENVTDLNRALAEIAARENAAKGSSPEPSAERMPELPFSGNVDPGQFRHGAEGLAGIMRHDRRLQPVSEEALAAGPPMSAPDDLKKKLLTEEPVRKRGVGRYLLLGTGLAACFAAGAYVWPMVQDRVLPGLSSDPVRTAAVTPVLSQGPTGIFTDPVTMFTPDATITATEPVLMPTAIPDPSVASVDGSPRIVTANPFQTQEQSRTALLISQDARQQEITAAANAAADRLGEVEAQISTAEQRLATLTSQEDLILSDITTLRNEQLALTQEVAAVRAELNDLARSRLDARQGLEALEAERTALRGEIGQSEARLENLTAALTTRGSELEARAAAAADAELLRSDALAEIADLQAQKDDLAATVAKLNDERVALADTVAGGHAQILRLQTELGRYEIDLAARQEQLAEVTAAFDAARAALAEAEQTRENATEAVAAAQAEKARLDAQLADTANARDAAEALRLALTDDIAAARSTLADLAAQDQAMQDRIAAARQDLEAREASAVAADDRVAEAEQRLADLVADESALTTRIAATRGDLATAEADLAALQDAIASAQAQRDASVAALNLARLSETEALARVDEAAAAAEAEATRLDALSAQRDAAEAEIDRLAQVLNADMARRSQALTRIATSQSELQDVSAKLALSEAALADLDARKADAETTVAGVSADLQRVRAEFAALQTDRDRLRDRVAAEEARLDAIRADQASADAAVQAKLAELDDAQAALDRILARTAAATPQPLPELTSPGAARPAAVVDAALLKSPGLDALSDAQANALRDALVQGHCVADALKAITGRANPFTVRALRRSVGACEE